MNDELKVDSGDEIVIPESRDNIPFSFPILDPHQRTLFLREITRPVSVIVAGTAAATDTNYGVFFVADRSYRVVSINERHRTAGSDGGTVTVSVEKCASGTAPDSGVDLLSSAFNLKATANTTQYGSLTKTKRDLILKRGDALILKDAGVLTNVAQVCVSVLIQEF